MPVVSNSSPLILFAGDRAEDTHVGDTVLGRDSQHVLALGAQIGYCQAALGKPLHADTLLWSDLEAK